MRARHLALLCKSVRTGIGIGIACHSLGIAYVNSLPLSLNDLDPPKPGHYTARCARWVEVILERVAGYRGASLIRNSPHQDHRKALNTVLQ